MSKVVAITGGGGVLCSVMAKALAKKGYRIALLDRNMQAMEAVAAEIKKDGGEVYCATCDVLSRESLQGAKEAINKNLGKVNILINGAGGNHPKGTTTNDYFSVADMQNPDKTSFFDLEGDAVDSVFRLNFLGTFLTTQVFAKDMLEGGGNILNISSMNAYRPLTRIPAYSAAKAGISNFTAWLAVYFAESNIRVNAIAPGFFVTNQNKGLLFDKDGAPTARTRKILGNTPMNRFGKPEELLGTVEWLLSDEASGFVTGIVVPIDGGFSAYSGV